jgi:hypothetical protein
LASASVTPDLLFPFDEVNPADTFPPAPITLLGGIPRTIWLQMFFATTKYTFQRQAVQ